mmetsp:Transcript_10383/g.22880  ORF Transcript_10383/g.22880 Transcript_10383/m.22880 type:complete len:154 (-) Transcript_10383:305-766(-)
MGDGASKCCGNAAGSAISSKLEEGRSSKTKESASLGSDSTSYLEVVSSFRTKFEFTVKLDNREAFALFEGDGPLGLDVAHHRSGELVVEHIKPHSLAQDWNDENPDERIQPGDRLQKVNDIAGDVALMVQECQRKKVLNITFSRLELAHPAPL